MLNVEQFRYGADNLAYLIYGTTQAMAIDGGAWQEILSFLESNNLIAYVCHQYSSTLRSHVGQRSSAQSYPRTIFEFCRPFPTIT